MKFSAKVFLNIEPPLLPSAVGRIWIPILEQASQSFNVPLLFMTLCYSITLRLNFSFSITNREPLHAFVWAPMNQILILLLFQFYHHITESVLTQNGNLILIALPVVKLFKTPTGTPSIDYWHLVLTSTIVSWTIYLVAWLDNSLYGTKLCLWCIFISIMFVKASHCSFYFLHLLSYCLRSEPYSFEFFSFQWINQTPNLIYPHGSFSFLLCFFFQSKQASQKT